MKRIIEWFKESNRYLHLLLGIPVGLLPLDWYHTELLAGGSPDPIDFVLTVIGVNIGYLLKLGFIATL